MDRTRFCASYSKTYLVITLNFKKLMVVINLGNWKYIISVNSISGDRKTILPILILCDIQILEKWIQKNDFNNNILLVSSPTRYSNDELAL